MNIILIRCILLWIIVDIKVDVNGVRAILNKLATFQTAVVREAERTFCSSVPTLELISKFSSDVTKTFYFRDTEKKSVFEMDFFGVSRKKIRMMSAISRKKVIVAGHICLDITPAFPETSRGQIHQLFVPGKLINVENAQIHVGGAVANTGLAMAFFGSEVQLMGKVGQDEFGENIIRIVRSHNVSEGMILSKTSHTSYSIVLAIPGHDRIFLHYPGANDTFEYEDLDMEAIQQAALFHFGYPPLMNRLYINNGQELTKIFRAVSNAGVVTSLDLAAVDPKSPAGQVDWQTVLSNTLPFVDIFVPSVEELLFMLDRGKYEQFIRDLKGKDLTTIVSVQRDVKPLAERALQMGAKIVMIKCGEPGVYFKTTAGDKISVLENKLGFSLVGWSNREGFEASYVAEHVVSATGAGDVTIAAFLISLLSGYPLETCLNYATASGACCVEAYDSLSGLKSLKEIQEKIDSGWKKKELLET
jgi:sugar/nucleoside kinase (ribokinase family)